MIKLIVSILFYFFFFNLSIAQSPSYFKLKDGGTLYKIIRTTSSEFVTVSSDASGGGANLKLQITKWDSAFTELWSLEFDSSDLRWSSAGSGIFESNNGSIYCSTHIMDSEEFVVFKISSSGSIIWQKTYGVDGALLNAWAFQKAAQGDDGFVFGTGACSSSNAIVKCDENGNIEWQQKYYHNAASATMTCWGIINDGDNYIISSKFNGNSVLNFRIDDQGGLLDYSAYANTNNSMSCKGSIAYGSGYLIYGDYNSSIHSGWVAYFDSTHNLIGCNDFSFVDSIFNFNGISVDENGQNILINGAMFEELITPGTVDTYLFIASISQNGNINWQHKAEGASNPYPTNPNFHEDISFADIVAWSDKIASVGNSFGQSMVVSIMDDDGTGLCDPLETNLVVSHPVLTLQSGICNVYSSNIFDSISNYTYTTYIDYNRTYYCGDTTLAINKYNNNQTELILYPNPFSNHLTIEMPSNKTYVLNVYDMLGNRVYLEEEVKENILLERGALVGGVYMVELKSGHDTYRKKVILR